MRDRDYTALADFRYALRRFLHWSEEAAAQAGISPQQHQALLAVRGAGAESPTVGYLAERLQVKHHSAVGLVDRLQGLGLLVRRMSPRDGRQVLLALTPRGSRLLADLSREHQRELTQMARELRSLLLHLPSGRVIAKSFVRRRRRSEAVTSNRG
jgi:DNA-binding MarR family transcriptional regulator